MLKHTISIFLLVLLVSVRIQAENRNSLATDSTQIKMETKLSFYQQELKKNNEVIQQLENELQQRKTYSERLTGAIAATQEMLMQLNSGEKAKNPNNNN
jgi:septal ring factor EnvC (AmiA/AmiB activator)